LFIIIVGAVDAAWRPQTTSTGIIYRATHLLPASVSRIGVAAGAVQPSNAMGAGSALQTAEDLVTRGELQHAENAHCRSHAENGS
jgi:hypothetical protein